MLYDNLSTMSDKDDDSKNNESFGEESKATLLVNTVMYKNISPFDIRKLLSVPEKKKPPNKSKSDKKIIANKTSISLEDNTNNELVINGKVYWSINNAVTYFLSKHDRTHT